MADRKNTCFHMAFIEYKRWIRSSKMIVLPILLIIIKRLVADPLIRVHSETGIRISAFEPFLALTNSGIILLMLPLLFMVLMSDFPQRDNIEIYYRIRCSRLSWLRGQLLFALIADLSFLLFVFLSTALMTIGHSQILFNYSKGITQYLSFFPDRTNAAPRQLLPPNLYNQIDFKMALMLGVVLLAAYLYMLLMVILLFYVMDKWVVGLLASIALIIIGTVLCAAKLKAQWLFPMSNAITWIHFDSYLREMIFPLDFSVLYLFGGNIIFIILCVLIIKKRRSN